MNLKARIEKLSAKRVKGIEESPRYLPPLSDAVIEAILNDDTEALLPPVSELWQRNEGGKHEPK